MGGVRKNHIILNQNLTDPAKIISGDINSEAIQWIRDNSHRYLGKYTGEGQMTICQLSDDNNGGKTDAVYFADTNYTYIHNPENDSRCDWFMRLPKFYYHAEELAPDIWDIGFGQEPEADDWNEWDGNDLIGCFKGSVRDSSLLSIRGVTPSNHIYQPNFKSYAQARGTGYSLVKFKHHSMMAFLFYAMYGNTNSQAICGLGAYDDDISLGVTDVLGMNDTTLVDSNFSHVNFWGLEDWWGYFDEYIDNVSFSGYHWKIEEDDGTIVDILGVMSGDVIYKVYVGSDLYMVPIETEKKGSYPTGFCDYYEHSSANIDSVSVRSGVYPNGNIGVSYLSKVPSENDVYLYRGSRLAFRGDIIVENDVPTFRSIPITNDGYGDNPVSP